MFRDKWEENVCSLLRVTEANDIVKGIKELKDKLSRRNMQIKELKLYKGLTEQILNMTNIHGVYKNDTDCINSIRETINRRINNR